MYPGQQSQIIGMWITDPADKATLRDFGCASLQFQEDGKLTYISHDTDKDQVIFMTYRIDGQTLITEQPSEPREERTGFVFTHDGKLRLIYDGQAAVYIRRS